MRKPSVHSKAAYILFIVPLITLSLITYPVFADDSGEKMILEALKFIKDQKFDKSAEALSRVISDDFIINDFAYLWRAESYMGLGNYEKAFQDIQTIRSNYDDTSALKGALRLEIEIVSRKALPETVDIFSLYEDYITKYPEDKEMQFEYARTLRDRGFDEKAVEVFKYLYIGADDFSEEASGEIDFSDLDLDDILTRGNNLLGNWEFVKAEAALHRALQKAPESLKAEINEKIAYCNFKQKKYTTAAELYRKLNEKYMEGVSYLRTGNLDALTNTIDRLKSMKDPRTGLLLISFASLKRRDGQYDAALVTLRQTLSDFPFTEDVLWNIGWTEYTRGDYSASEKTFKDLYESYHSSRYLYWMLRSRERRSLATSEGFKELCSEKDYYGFLACSRNGLNIEKVHLSEIDVKVDSPYLKRFSLLKSLGFRDEALFELKRLIKSLNKRKEVILYSTKLKEIGEYKQAISVATMVPYNENTHHLLYPIAYWDVIQNASHKFDVNPIFILSIAREESRLDPEARSPAGALGLMQLMPSTAERMCKKIKCTVSDNESFYEIDTNVMLGTYYLKTLLEQFTSIPSAIAAYNAGEHNVRKWLNRNHYREADEFIEDIPYAETRRYVKKVLTTLFQYTRAYRHANPDDSLLNKISLSIH